jgi:hypothetical protein
MERFKKGRIVVDDDEEIRKETGPERPNVQPRTLWNG